MPWLKIDDGFISHPKIAALTDGELRLWMRILCFAAAHRRTRNGRISRQDRREISGFSEAKSARFQTLGLLDKTDTPGTVEVHDFDHYNPTDKTAAERKKRQRNREAGAVDNHESHVGVTRDTDRDETRDNSRVLRTRARSRTPTPLKAAAAEGPLQDPEPSLEPDEPAAAAETDEELETLLDDLALPTTLRDRARLEPARAKAVAVYTLANHGSGAYFRTVFDSGDHPVTTANGAASTPAEWCDRFVNATGYLLPDDELEYQLREHGADESQITGYMERAAALRGEPAL